MRPYRLIGKTTRNKIAECFLQAVIEWQKEWCVDVKQVQIDFNLEYLGSNVLGGCGLKSHGEYSLFYIEDQVNWSKLVFGRYSDECPNDVILTTSINDAKRALIIDIMKTLNADIDAELQSVELVLDSSLYSGSLFVCVYIDGQKLGFWVSSNLVDRFIPVRPNIEKTTLSRRADTCITALTSVTVRLNLGSFPIESIKSLTQGDVLSTDVKLDNPFSLKINEDKYLPVNLGRVEDNKAVIFLPNIKQ